MQDGNGCGASRRRSDEGDFGNLKKERDITTQLEERLTYSWTYNVKNLKVLGSHPVKVIYHLAPICCLALRDLKRSE